MVVWDIYVILIILIRLSSDSVYLHHGCFPINYRCKCATCAMYYASDDDSLNSQSRLAPVYPSPDVGPTFRFPASNQLKGYGARNTSPLYEEIHDKHHNGNANRDILRQRISSSESKSIKSEKL